MKKTHIAMLMVVCAALGISQISHATPFRCDFLDIKPGQFLVLMTLDPVYTVSEATTNLVCVFDSQLDTAMVEREAILIQEENKIYQPSYVGTYAIKHNFKSIQEAAQDIVENGVRK